MNDDEQFAASLRTQVTRVAPQIDVDVARVVPAARRRRAARVGGITLAMALALGGGAWVATTMERPGTALPGGSTTIEAEPSPTPSGPPLTSSGGDRLTEESSNPSDDPLLPPDGWRDATYLYVLTSSSVGKEGEGSSSMGTERWYGDGVSFELTDHGPELLDHDAYVTFEGADPVSYTWAELAALPTEPGRLHDTLLSDFSGYGPTGEAEDVMPDVAARLVTEAPVSAEVRAAAWGLLASLPSVSLTPDTEGAEGRTGTAATFVAFDRTTTVLFDEERNLPLEREESIGKMRSVDVFLEMEFTTLPDEVADGIVEVPDLTAMTVEDAGVACQQAHLTCTFEDTASDTVPEGTIISSDPRAGALVGWGALVTIQLSTGS